ncbi:hypothetical protein PV10_05346 [Exophiala mesophila]|uniref:Signal peptide peptidase n=1 Tax=Exophiala mesophila TaxID=212818 RepID=A0A0D1WNT3_EXOME|nr:uncharacterized protein PV10_05346 [Exophiala mesophila]KIV90720.1 hypothetical protein PV10_05346 [Exophiala mesophila]
MASQPGPVMEFLGRVAYELHLMRPLFPTYLHLLVSAIFPIYTAAHASLTRPPCAAPEKGERKRVRDDVGDDDEELDSRTIETLTPSDALLFPLLAGATLALLYFILKWLQDPAWLNWCLGLYFSQIGLFFATRFLKDAFSLLRSFSLPTSYSGAGQIWKVDQKARCFISNSGQISQSPLPGWLRHLPLPSPISRRIWTLRKGLYLKAQLDFRLHRILGVKTSVDLLGVVSLSLASALVYVHTFIAKPWYLTNFLGFSFCYGSLQFITPTTAWTGTLILGALFFYDIYFVFFTPMMVTVATKLDVPIKLLFPRPDGCVYPVGAPEGSQAMEEYLQCLAKNRTMAMLGLGDIVVPGMLLAFALRFDLYLFYLRQSNSTGNVEQEVSGDKKQTSPTYLGARGKWGERFWTGRRLWGKELQARSFPKPYFYATAVGYIIGMLATVTVMQVAQHAQPALLYLVPGVLLSLWGTALFRGDLKLLFDYSESPEMEQTSKEEKAKEPKQNKSEDKSVCDAEPGHDKDGVGVDVEQKPEVHVQKTGETRKGDKDQLCLIHFAITLPIEPSGSDVKTIADGTTQALSHESCPTDKMDTIPENVEGRIRDRENEGEPPGKRARKQ